MFTDSITDYEIKKYKKLDLDGKRRMTVNKGLGKIDRLMLSRIQTLISKITTEIEKESGWEYFMSEFTYLSDFNLYDGDIKFTENKVPVNFYVPELNDRELAFVLKYKHLLTRLQTLEQKRKYYYSKGMSKELDIPYEEPKRKSLLDESFIRGWTEKEATKFTKAFGNKGVERLVDNLNSIAEDRPLDELFSDFMKQNISSSYKKELLKWASTYSLKGNKLLERFINIRDRIVDPDTYPGAFMHDSDMIQKYK